jgi:HEAT repeat protein
MRPGNAMTLGEARRIAALLLSEDPAARDEGVRIFLGLADGELMLDAVQALGPHGDAFADFVASAGARAASLDEPLLALAEDLDRAPAALRLLERIGRPRTLAALSRAAAHPALTEPALRALAGIAERAGEEALPHLLALASDPSLFAEARAAALRAARAPLAAAARWSRPPDGDDEAAVLLELFQSAPPEVSAAAAEVLGACYGAMGDARQRRAAAQLVEGGEAGVALLTTLAGDLASPGRAAAQEALAAHLHRSLATPRLIELLRAPRPAVRAAAAGALAHLKEPSAAPALLDVLEDEALWSGLPGDTHADALGAFLDAVAALGTDERALRALILHVPLPRRVGLQATLFPGDDALPALAARLGSPAFATLEAAVSEGVRAGAAPPARLLRALAATGDPRCRHWLLRCLAQPAWNLVPLAVELLADHGRGEDTAVLLSHLPEVDPAWHAAPQLARTVADALRAILDRDLAAVPQVVLWRLASLKDRPLRVALPMVPLQVEQLELGELRARAAAELARRGRT